MKYPKILMLFAAMLMLADFAFAQTWTLTGAPNTGWRSVASSADGSRLIAAGSSWLYYTSTNSGTTWTTNIEPQIGSTYGSWSSIVISADGTRYVGTIADAIWVSTNAGTTWLSNNVPGVPMASFFGEVALSADGNKMVVGAGAYNSSSPAGIYISTNSGVTWEQTTAPPYNWTSIASSADGSKLVAVSGGFNASTNGNVIYISTNSGANWILTDTPTNILWVSVASSADGSKLVAASQATYVPGYGFIFGSVYTSTNSGMNWISNNLPSAAWQAVASSADGSKLVAMAQNEPIYTSTDSGVTWVSNNVSSQIWQSIASSADGGKLVAASLFGVNGNGPGSIYTLQTTPPPRLNLTPTNSNLTLSWIVPSANFGLQQSSDLGSWTDVTNTPVLNLTNLQNEVILSPTGNNGFYRLKTP